MPWLTVYYGQSAVMSIGIIIRVFLMYPGLGLTHHIFLKCSSFRRKIFQGLDNFIGFCGLFRTLGQIRNTLLSLSRSAFVSSSVSINTSPNPQILQNQHHLLMLPLKILMRTSDLEHRHAQGGSSLAAALSEASHSR